MPRKTSSTHKTLDAAKAAGEAAKKAIAERNTAIKTAVAGGTSARQVALVLDLTHAAVLKIVRAK
jgi:DNA-binding NarL/FixJ family response regulator